MNIDVKPTIKGRLLEELRKYALVSLYLYICFAVLLLYKAAILGTETSQALPHGLALIKALILAKFILIGEAVGTGKSAEKHHFLRRIAWKSIAFLFVLLLFTAIEEIFIGWVHGKSMATVVTEFLERSWVENLGPSLLMLLILISMISITEIKRTLGPKRFKELFYMKPGEQES